jgi:teichoic acid transport system permease protein
MVEEVARAPRTGLTRPTVGVVMPVSDAWSRLEGGIASVLGQEGVDVRLVLVDDGSSVGAEDVVAPLVSQDSRVSFVWAEHPSPGAGRNRGVAELETTYVVFADGHNVVPEGAYALMAQSLEATGSDVCLGAVEQLDADGARQVAWSREVHSTAVSATTLVDHPVLVKDLVAINRMTRLAFWRGCGLSFPEAEAEAEDDETHLPMLRSLVEAHRIDVVTDVVCRRRVRSDGPHSSAGGAEGLASWARARWAAWNYLGSAYPEVRDAWLGRMLDIDLPPFLAVAPTAADDYRTLLGDVVRTYADLADEGALRWVRGQQRARAKLAAQGRWDDLALLSRTLAEVRLRELTVVEEGELRLDPDLLPVGGLPDAWRTLSRWQSRASARVLSVAARSDGEPGLRLDGTVSVYGSALGPMLDRCTVKVRTPEGRRPAQVRRRGRSGNAASVGFRLDLDAQPRPEDVLEVDIRVEGLERETLLKDPGGLLTKPPPVVPSPQQQMERPEVMEGSPAELAARYNLRRVGVRPTLGAYLGEIWRRRDFVRVLSSAAAYAANSNLHLGQLWTVLRPMLDAAVYVLVFGILLGTSRGLDNFVGFIVIGTFFYRCFSESLTSGARSLVTNMNLVRSLPFPRALLPVSNVMSQFVSLVPALGVMVGFILISPLVPPTYAPVVISWKWLMMPVAVVLLAIFSVGAGLIAARVAAFFPDVLNTLPFLLRLLMYASGVIFSISHFVHNPVLQRIMELQPVAVYLNLARQSLLVEPSIPWDWTLWLIGLGWSVLFLVAGAVFFWSAEARYGRE